MIIAFTAIGLCAGNVAYQAALLSPDFTKAAMISWHQITALGAYALIRAIFRGLA